MISRNSLALFARPAIHAGQVQAAQAAALHFPAALSRVRVRHEPWTKNQRIPCLLNK